jgi:hypothetical protein
MSALSIKVGRLSHSVAWPIWVCTGSALFLGLSLGAWMVTYRNSTFIENQKLTIASLTGRTALLTEALKNQSELASKADRVQGQGDAPLEQSAVKQKAFAEKPATPKPTPKESTPPVVAPATVTATVQTPAAKSPLPVALPAIPPAPVAKAEKAEILQNAPAPQKAPAARAQAVNQAQPNVAQNTSTPSPQATPASTRIEGVTQEKAGISKIWNNAIDFKSGLRVRVGEKFPSGETLVMIDGAAGRIVTDQRQILILDK